MKPTVCCLTFLAAATTLCVAVDKEGRGSDLKASKTAEAGAATNLWATHVQPLLAENCFTCHGELKQKSGLDLRTPDSILKGGERGPAIVPGKPEESNLFKFVHSGSDPKMPPGEKKPLSEQQIAILKAWIKKYPTDAASALSQSVSNAPDWNLANYPASPSSKRPKWSPPNRMPANEVIDRFIELGWKERHVTPAARCDDRTFVRRVYLDLAGRIPTDQEAEQFLKDRRHNKRAVLVDALLSGENYPRHMREVFDVVLMGRSLESQPARRRASQPSEWSDKWSDFLEASFSENRPWDQIVRELILARPSTPEQGGAVWYLYQRNSDFQAMAEAVAPIAFGVQVKCAQCHNHPLAHEILQKHYWGLVAAFNRSKNVETPEGPAVAEAAIGGFISFTNLKKESQPALLAFLNGKVVPEERPAADVKETDAPENYLIPPPKEKEKPVKAALPKFSRREQLAEAVTQDNPFLARAFVNRIWAMLLGRGLVHPVDEMDSKHPCSHPELLDWLAKDFERSGYDVKRLIRIITATRAYQLGSRPRGKAAPPPDTFAHALEKPLSAEQLFASVLVATGNTPDAEGKIGELDIKQLRPLFVAQFPDLFPTEYNATLQQAMFLANNPKLDALLQRRPGNSTDQLLALGDAGERVKKAFTIVYGRLPDTDELKRALNYLEARQDRAEASVKQLLWALLTSTEFQLNH
jgi:mono/diheme cytochrome c family protein